MLGGGPLHRVNHPRIQQRMRHAADPTRRAAGSRWAFLTVRGPGPARAAFLLKDFVVVKNFRRYSVGNPSQQQKFTLTGWHLRYSVLKRPLL
jgi:hypothetical protein